MPHVHWAEVPLVSFMGKYDQDKVKVRNERNRDFQLYLEKVDLHALWDVCLTKNCLSFFYMEDNDFSSISGLMFSTIVCVI